MMMKMKGFGRKRSWPNFKVLSTNEVGKGSLKSFGAEEEF
jgi:hypothetical protein